MARQYYDSCMEMFEYANDIKPPSFRLFSIWSVRGEKNYYADYSKNTFTDQENNMYSLVRIIAGEGFLRTKKQTFALAQNDLLFLKYNDILNYGSDSEQLKFHWYNIRSGDSDFFIPVNTHINLPLSNDDLKTFDRMSDFLIHRTTHDTALANLEFCKYYIFLAKQINISAKKGFNQYSEMQLVRDYIVHNIKENINFTELAKKFGFSDRSLRSHFKANFDMSPKEFQSYLRMNEACLLLANTSYNLEFIADKLGYQSAFYFSKVFKQSFGISPSKYRNK